MEGLSTFFQNFTQLLSPIIEFMIWMFPLKIYRLHDGEKGVILTFGKVRRKKAEVGPGTRFCFCFEEIDACQAVNGYINFEEQNIQTKNGRVMVVDSAVTYDIINFQKAMLETDDIEQVVACISLNEMREYSKDKEIDEIVESDKLTNGLTKRINKKLKKHGILINHYLITDLRPHDMIMLCDTAKEVGGYFKPRTSSS